MVFQSYALYPHLTVRNNMSLGLKQAKEPASYIKERVEVAADMLALGPYLDRHPSELSGGQRQRVAIGRAIVRKPRLFLFDEPLSNLEAALRVNTRLEIARLHRELDASMIYVTHDQTEAMTLADKIVVLQDGEVEQIGSPMDLYNNPGNLFVAGFLGSPSMNFLDPKLLDIGKAKTVGIRPEHITLSDSGKLEGEISHIEQLGGDTNVYVRLKGSELVTVRLFGQHQYSVGSDIHLTFDDDNLYLFDENDQRIR